MSGSGRTPEPPRAARRLLRTLVGEASADTADAELAEGFRARMAQVGHARARRWYWRQVAGFLVRYPLVRSARDRESTATQWIEEALRDFRWAVRGLLRRPSLTAAAVLTLAMGIGAITAVFTLISAHYLAPLPYGRPDELVLIWETSRNSLDVTTVAPGNYFTWREDTRSFTDVAAFNVDAAVLSDGDGAAERVTASVVTPAFFDVLGTPPLLGRGFDEESARAADGRQVVLGYSLWLRRYGGDAAIVGRDIRVDGIPHRVVGVMPATFRQPERSLTWQRPEVWRPMLLEDERGNYRSRYLRTVARLAPEATLQRVRAEMDGVSERMAREYPEENGGRSILVWTLDEYLMSDARPTLVTLLVAAAAVFLLVCANVANLTLARGEQRQREFALRAALGSGHKRLLLQTVLEGVILAMAGALVGTALVYAAEGALQSVQLRFFSGLVDVQVDARAITFTAVAALCAGVLSGLPMLRTVRSADLRAALGRGNEGAGGGSRGRRTRGALVTGQVAIATALTAVAVLLSRSFNELVAVDPGFDADGVMTFTLSPSPEWEGREGLIRYFSTVSAELEAVPGVAGVGIVSDMPFTTENRWTVLERDAQPGDGEEPRAEFHSALPGYFEVMRIPRLAGRFPENPWTAQVPVPVLVNEEMADRFWPAGSALGATFRIQRDTLPYSVVGVVGNELDDGFSAQPDPVFYLPLGSAPSREMWIVLRITGDERGVAESVRAAVARVDADVPAGGLRMLEDLMAETVVRPRAASLIGGVFALLALVIAAAGIYGVLSYTVQSRTREIGIRSALGASREQLVGMVLGQSGRLLLLGLLFGWIGALLAGRAVSGILFGVKSWDPPSLIAATVLLFLAGTAASWIPARRAVRVDPRDALRAE